MHTLHYIQSLMHKCTHTHTHTHTFGTDADVGFFTTVFPHIPSCLQISPVSYKQTRIAENVCVIHKLKKLSTFQHHNY